MSQGYMMVAELMTCRMPEDPATPIQAGGGIRHGIRVVL
jgi:hypothetical protein